MTDLSRTVFLSYRREVSWQLANAVEGDLRQHGFDVFIDSRSLDSGEFKQTILAQVGMRRHFLLLLEPRSLDRLDDEGDWLRREIAHALVCGRNIVPLLAGGLRMPAAADLPSDVAGLASYNALDVPHEYFPEAMQKLRQRFLRGSPGSGGLPAPQARAIRLELERRNTKLYIRWYVSGLLLHEYPPVEVQASEVAPGYREKWTTIYRGTSRFHWADLSPTDPPRSYRARTLDEPVPGPWSQVVRAADPPTADTPIVFARHGPWRTLVHWTRVQGARLYEVERTPLTGPTSIVYRGEKLAWTDWAAMMNSDGNYRARAIFDGGRVGPWSELS